MELGVPNFSGCVDPMGDASGIEYWSIACRIVIPTADEQAKYPIEWED